MTLFKLQVQKVRVVSCHIVFQQRYKGWRCSTLSTPRKRAHIPFHMENWLIILYFSGDGKECVTSDLFD